MLPEPEFVDIDLEKGTEEEFFCRIALQTYHKRTNANPSPDVKPYLIRLIDHSRHNGDSESMRRMKREITDEDELFLTNMVNNAMTLALKDSKEQINNRIPKRDAMFYVGIASFACTIISTGATLAATLDSCNKH
jgi:hypothetical protein